MADPVTAKVASVPVAACLQPLEINVNVPVLFCGYACCRYIVWPIVSGV
jgi:hypothetical protein